MDTLFLALFQLGSLFVDINLVLKIVGMLFIYSFVKSHVQHPILSLVLIVGLCAFLLFDFWIIFGGALVLYLLAMFGVMHILVDLSFMHAFTKPLLNIGGLLSSKRPTPSPQMMQEHEMQEAHRRQQQAQEEEYGEHEHGPEHQGDNRRAAQLANRQPLTLRQRAEYERMRRSTKGRGRDDERGR